MRSFYDYFKKCIVFFYYFEIDDRQIICFSIIS